MYGPRVARWFCGHDPDSLRRGRCGGDEYTVRAGDNNIVDHIWTMTVKRRRQYYTQARHRGNDDRSPVPTHL